MINTNYSTTEIIQGLNYTQEFKHLVVVIFLLCSMNVLLTFKIKSVLKNNHTLQQQSQLLLSVKKNETRKKFDEKRLTDKETNQRGQALGSLIYCTKRKESQC